FSYSHGLETAVADGVVHDRASLEAWVSAIIAHGSGRLDADILRDAYRAAERRDQAALAAAHRRGVAYRATAELALEAAQQGAAGLRLGIIGQTDGQRILAAVEPVVIRAAKAAATRDPADFGAATLAADLASMQHEVQYTRLFRS